MATRKICCYSTTGLFNFKGLGVRGIVGEVLFKRIVSRDLEVFGVI
jgi:hypothetical protein